MARASHRGQPRPHRNRSRGAPGAQRYLEAIDYGVYRVAFAYEPRPDRLRWTRGGFVCATDERCATIELRIPDAARPRVRRWELGYAQSEPSGASLLVDGDDDRRSGRRHRAVDPTTHDALHDADRADGLVRIRPGMRAAPRPAFDGRGRVELIDWDGDGVADVLEIGTGGDAPRCGRISVVLGPSPHRREPPATRGRHRPRRTGRPRRQRPRRRRARRRAGVGLPAPRTRWISAARAVVAGALGGARRAHHAAR